MFLVKVLTGVSFNCPDGDSKLRMPPEKEDSSRSIGGEVQFSQMRYDNVTGQTYTKTHVVLLFSFYYCVIGE